MKYSNNRIFSRALLLLCLAGLGACTGDPDGGTAGDQLAVRIRTRVSGGMSSPTAAGFSDVRLGTIDVLSFDENEVFLYRAAATVIHDNGESFEATLRKNHAEKTQTLVVLANLRDEIEAFPLTAGVTTKTELQQGLVFGFTHHTDPDGPAPDADKVFGQQRLLPMWGESLPLVLWADEQEIETLYLLRAVASVTVTVDLEDDTAQKDFELLTVVIYNTPAHGLAIPEDGNIREWYDTGGHYLKVDTPTVPATTYGKAYYFDPTGQAGFVNTIYVGEKKNSATGTEDSDTWLVLGGTYDGQESWYRLPFIDTDGQVRDVLRNHEYIFTIKKVTGPGSPGEEDQETAEIEVELKVEQWDISYPNPINPEITLNVSAVKASINERNMARIYFSTNQPADSV